MIWLMLFGGLVMVLNLPCSTSKDAPRNIPSYQVFQHFGCYHEQLNITSFSFGDNLKNPDPVRACADAVFDEGYKTFYLRNGGYCLSGPEKVEEFYRAKKSSRCRNGVGGNGVVDVYFFGNRDVKCPVAIRHSLNSYCIQKITKEINANKKLYQLAPTFLDLFPGLKATPGQLQQIYQNDPVNAEWMGIYLKVTNRNLYIAMKYLKQTYGKEFKTIDDYKTVLKFMIKSQFSLIPKEHHKYFKFYFMQPDKPFGRLTRMCNWREDRVFTDQRFAGINPMSIQRVASPSKGGFPWTSLHKRLSTSFNWEAAILDALGMNISLNKAIDQGHVFVLRYPLLDGIPARDEPPSSVIKGRKIMSAISPIAIFVSKPSRDRSLPNEIIPVAIQMGHTNDSSVFTPNDADKWLLAKQTVQVADFVYLGSVEHLLKTHLFVEPICVAVLRHFSVRHPLRQLLQFHCRGVLGTNKFNIKNLTGINGTSDRLFGVGYEGGYLMMKKAFENLSWDDTDFRANIKKRGMADKSKVPYFPYRDDGELIYSCTESMVKEYVHFYYRVSCHVEADPDIKNFLNEVSLEGEMKPDGGKGKLRKFPTAVKTRRELIDLLTRIIWTTSAQHSAVNYASNYYGSYTPNMPTKLYNDPRVRDGQFDVYNLPDKTTATIQAALGLNLGSLRYDHLFDYGNDLEDKPATEIVTRHANWLNGFVATVIEARNRKRDKMNHLPYPYLVPGWIANSIHT